MRLPECRVGLRPAWASRRRVRGHSVVCGRKGTNRPTNQRSLAHSLSARRAVPCAARHSERAVPNQEAVWQSFANCSTTSTAFERTSKRRRGYPSETRVKRGVRVVHGDKELLEKLGRNDLCPCGSGRRFQALLSRQR